MTIKVKKTFAGATLPTSGSKYAAGYDLYAHTETGAQRIPAGRLVGGGSPRRQDRQHRQQQTGQDNSNFLHKTISLWRRSALFPYSEGK